MNGRPWTGEERARLVALKAAGLKHAAIAAELGRPVGAVTAELYSLRHPGRQEANQRAYRARHGERVRERNAERHRASREEVNARHRAWYADNRGKVLARQAARRRDCLSRGGSNHPSNLATACQRCNLEKGQRTVEEWRR